MTNPTAHGVSVFDGLVDAPSDLSAAIARVLNQHSAENVSNTPDYILGQFLDACLSAFDAATQQRETWYGRDARPTLIATAERAGEPVLRKFDHASEDRAKLALYAIGEAMGYGWAQAELGAEWERRHDCAPRGRMGVTVSDAPPAQAEPQEGDLLHTMMEWARTEEGRKQLADSYRPHLWACAKRVADPQNEAATCRHWCGDIEHCQPIASAPAQAEPQPEPPADALVEALRAGRQADADGVMVIVSRQACEEAADRIAALTAEVDEDNAEIASLCEAAERAESALAAANERERGLREALQAAADSMTCRDDAAHYCPNCDRSSYKARDDARAALARKEGE